MRGQQLKAVERLVQAVDVLIGYTDGFYRHPSVEVATEVQQALKGAKRALREAKRRKAPKPVHTFIDGSGREVRQY